MKMAMFVGDSRHYALQYIRGRHFIQTAERAGLPGTTAPEALDELAGRADEVLEEVENGLPKNFPGAIPESIRAGFLNRLRNVGKG